MYITPKKEDDLKDEDNLKNGDDLENEDNIQNEGDLKNEEDLKNWPYPSRLFRHFHAKTTRANLHMYQDRTRPKLTQP